MTNARRLLIKIEKGIVRAEEVGIVLTVFALILALTFQMAARFGLPFELDWTEEVSRIGLLWLIGLGAAIATFRGEHFLVEFMTKMLSNSIKKIWATTIRLMTMVFAATMTMVSVNSVKLNWGQIYPVLEIPVGTSYLALVACFGLMAFHAFVGVVTDRLATVESDHPSLGTGAD